MKHYFKSEFFLRTIFLVSLFAILLVGGFTYKHISNLTNSTKLVVGTLKVNVELEHLMSFLRSAESGQRNYMVTNDTLFLKPYVEAIGKINNSFLQIKSLTKIDDEQQENLTTLNTLIDKLFSNFSITNDFVEKDETDTESFKSLIFEEKIIMDSIRNHINEMINLSNELLNFRQQDYQSDLQFTPLFFYLVLLFLIVLIIIIYYKITIDFKKIKVKNDQLLVFKESTNQSEIIGNHANWTWDIDTNRFTFSDNHYRLLGEEPQSFEATLNNFLQFVHPEDVDKLTTDLEKMTDVEELPFIYYRIIQKNGSIKHVKAYGKAFYSKDGKKRLLGTTTDITDEIESVLALEEQNLELVRNNKELSAFNYAASHDLQEPLRKIQTFISRLEDKEAVNFSESGHQYLERIKSASARMRLLIDDLLQFSRTNKPEKEFVVADLNELFENAKQDVAEIVLDKKAKITSETLPKIPVIVFQMQQLFLNLLTNSLKYSKKGTAPIIKIGYSKVKVTDEPDLEKATKNNYHKITFSDNGIGFDQKYAKTIFDLFNRLHNKQDYSGTGIGLSICKKIIENHKGFIFAKGEKNVGSVFTVYLPFS
jgi:hypothetical protein